MAKRKPKTITTLADLTPDTSNARSRTERGHGMIVDSIHEVGLARSIVIDEDGRVLAGNGTVAGAAEAGVTKVMTVDADGETVVAVRRTGLTEAQKTRLALLDNRTAELATWDGAVLARLSGEGADLSGIFSDGELADITKRFDVDGVDAPMLASGDRDPFRTMTFTLHDSQFAVVEAALKRARVAGHAESEVNGNSNGNLLAAICEAYRHG